MSDPKASFLNWVNLSEDISYKFTNKRAQRALGRSPEEKIKGQDEAIILI